MDGEVMSVISRSVCGVTNSWKRRESDSGGWFCVNVEKKDCGFETQMLGWRVGAVYEAHVIEKFFLDGV